MTAYRWDAERGIWHRDNTEGLAYSDGQDVELRILEVIKGARDRSTFSPELIAGITDWPSEYHLSRSRHCLIRPLGIKPGERVLELGCGCGAITRYLGEIGADVTAVEGAETRARVAAERCRDLPNVKVILDDLLDFESDQQFDWVLLIGVLEYAPLFSKQEDAATGYLRAAALRLTEDGKLVVAIENKLGLKYFNGCAEDHVGIPLFGIQDLYEAKTPRTYGREELIARLAAAGLPSTYFLYPFPDYKLPSVIFSDTAIADPQFDVVDLIVRCPGRDYSGSRYRFFDEVLVFSALDKNGLVAEFCNSFLVVGAASAEVNIALPELAMTFSVNRLPEFSTQTRFLRSNDEIRVIKEPVQTAVARQKKIDGFIVSCNLPITSTYHQGRQLLWRLLSVRARGGGLDQITATLLPWVNFLIQRCNSSDSKPPLWASGDKTKLDLFTLSGRYLDCTPFNLIESPDGLALIDDEWRMDGEIPLGWVLTRGVLHSFGVGITQSDSVQSIADVVQELCRITGLSTTEAKVAHWLELEAELQSVVTGNTVRQISASHTTPGSVSIISHLATLTQTSVEQVNQIASLNQAAIVQSQKIASLSRTISERDKLISERDNRLVEFDAVLSSTTWRMTAPLRFFVEKGKRTLAPMRNTLPRPVKGIPRVSLRALEHWQTHGFKALARDGLRALTKKGGGAALATQSKTKAIDEILSGRFPAIQPLRVFSVPRTPKRINLVTDSINSGSLFGGVGTAIIFSALLAKKFDCALRVITRTERAREQNFQEVLRLNGIAWAKNVEFAYLDSGDTRAEIDVGETDWFITTSWWTTSSVKASIDEAKIIYLLQEDERMFYALGDDHVRCAELLKNSKIKFIINSQLLYEHFIAEGFHNIRDRGLWFEPAFHRNIFYRDEQPSAKKRFFFYARPHNLRNLYFRGLDVIETAVSRGILDLKEWDFYFVGKDLYELRIGEGYNPQLLQNLGWEDYASLVRKMDLGFCLMYTPHPSYPPLDLAASGAVVVTNRYGNKRRLSQYSKNILCSDLDTESLVQGIEAGVRLVRDDALRMKNYQENTLGRDWKTSFEGVLSRLNLVMPDVPS